METCIFCRITAGELPSTKVAENDSVIAIRDIAPKAPVHILVIPRAHYSDVHAIPDEKMNLMGEIFALVNTIVAEEDLAEKGYRLVINSGKNGCQAVPHLHVHILGGQTLSPAMG